MAIRLLLARLPGESRAAWLDDSDRLRAFRLQRDRRGPVAGDFYRARIQFLDPALKAAFVNLGNDVIGFLPFDKQHRLREGQDVLARVGRAPAEDKGPKLTLVSERELDAARPAWAAPPAATALPLRLIEGDDLFCWPDTPPNATDPGRGADRPGCVTQRLPDRIVCDDREFLQQLHQRFAAQPAVRARLALHSGPAPLFDAGLDARIAALLTPEVALPGGGYLLIEPVRTLTAIDVNAGQQRSDAGQPLSRLVNHAALVPLVEQIRLRDLSGQILVDFLQPDSRKDRQDLGERLAAALAEDAVPCHLARIGSSGLAEITRQRRRPPLHELLCERAGIGGSGWRDSPVAVAFSLLRQLRAAGPSARAVLEVSGAVELAFKGEARAAFKQAQKARGGGVSLARIVGLADSDSNLRLL